jgi:hypothetical protein
LIWAAKLFFLDMFIAGPACLYILWTLWSLQVWASLHVQSPLRFWQSDTGSSATSLRPIPHFTKPHGLTSTPIFFGGWHDARISTTVK